jgi:hypothetical protein
MYRQMVTAVPSGGSDERVAQRERLQISPAIRVAVVDQQNQPG